MKTGKINKLNRAQRLVKLLRTGSVTAWEIIHAVGTASPSKVVSEARKLGHRITMRRGPAGYYEYTLGGRG